MAVDFRRGAGRGDCRRRPAASRRTIDGRQPRFLADAFPTSPINIDSLGHWFGETHFGLVSQVGLGAIEGFLFGTGITVAIRYSANLLRELSAD